MIAGGAGRKRVRSAIRRGLLRLRQPPIAILTLAFVVLAAMFFSNSDMGGDPHTPRGDGKYRPVLARGDGHMMFLMSRSLVLDGDLVFDNDLARFGDPWRQKKTATGRKDIPHPIGPPLVWAPVLAVAHGASKVVNLFGADIPSHGYTIFHHRIVFLTSVIFGFGAVVIGFLLARRLVGGRWAPVFAAVAILFGTSITYYSTYMPSYGHAVDAFACAAFLGYWAYSYGDLRIRRFVILGGLLGICALIRVQEFAMGIVLVVEFGIRAFERPTDGRRAVWIAGLLGRGLLTLGVAIVAFTPQLIAWKVVYGEFLYSRPGYVRLDLPMAWELLFSSRNGWLATTPLAYAGALGLLLAPRKARAVTTGLLAALSVQVYLNSCVWDWWSQASYGQRRLCSVTLILVVGLAFLISACNRAARRLPVPARLVIAILIFGWFITWNLNHVGRLRAGKAPGTKTRTMCCRNVPGFMAGLSQPVYDLVGNPFALPASALFAWKYDVPPKQWDVAVGLYADRPTYTDYMKGIHRKRRFNWNVPGVHFGPYLLGGMGPRQGQPRQRGKNRPFRWTLARRARFLVPLFMPETHRFSIQILPNIGPDNSPVQVKLRLNGKVYAEREFTLQPGQKPAWTELTFEVPRAGFNIGNNELTIEATPRAYELDAWSQTASYKPPPPPARNAKAGVAVGPMVITYPSPKP